MRYRSSSSLEEDIFLHPNSALHRAAPEFVAYSELVRTAKRPYMAGEWLVPCNCGQRRGRVLLPGCVEGSGGWVGGWVGGWGLSMEACFCVAKTVVYQYVMGSSQSPCSPHSHAGVTAVDPSCLPAVAAPLCTFGPPLTNPAPAYAPTRDAVLCWRDVSFGSQGWELPRQLAHHPDPVERAAFFAVALLEVRMCLHTRE